MEEGPDFRSVQSTLPAQPGFWGQQYRPLPNCAHILRVLTRSHTASQLTPGLQLSGLLLKDAVPQFPSQHESNIVSEPTGEQVWELGIVTAAANTMPYRGWRLSSAEGPSATQTVCGGTHPGTPALRR